MKYIRKMSCLWKGLNVKGLRDNPDLENNWNSGLYEILKREETSATWLRTGVKPES